MEYLFFCSHDREKHGKKSTLSNWYPTPFEMPNGIKFVHTEQYMMLRKSALFGDKETSILIMNETDPQKCKALGREVKGFNQEVWNTEAQKIMVEGLLLKFTQNPELLEYLLQTGEKELVEAASYDEVWGIGLNEEDVINIPELEWPGKNWLGVCLMIVRDLLRPNASIGRTRDICTKCLNALPEENKLIMVPPR